MPQPQALKAERAIHPRGEAGSSISLEKVAERIRIDRADPDIVAWVSKVIFDAQADNPRSRAEAIFAAFKREFIWMPDPVDAELIPRAGLILGKSKKFWAQDCDGASVALGSAFEAAGIPVLVVGAGYTDRKTKKYDGLITHVLIAAFLKDRDDTKSQWWLVEGSRKNYPIGTADKMARERVLEPLTGDVVCDGPVCMADGGGRIPENIVYRRSHGDYVGVSGPPEDGDEVIDFDSAIPVGISGPLDPALPPLTSAALQQYAQAHTEEAARQYVLAETGVDPADFIHNGQIDWVAVTTETSKYYTGIDPTGFINRDGTINWREAAKDAAGATAAAFCTSQGLAGIAALCRVGGSAVGEALYDVAAIVIDLFDGGAPPAPYVSNDQKKAAVVAYVRSAAGTKTRLRLRNLLTLRAMALTSYETIYRLANAWKVATGDYVDLEFIQAKLAVHGFLWHEAFNHAGGPNMYMPQYHAWWTAYDLAYAVFGVPRDPNTTDYDTYQAAPPLHGYTVNSWDIYPIEQVQQNGHWGIVEVIPGSVGYNAKSESEAVAWAVGQTGLATNLCDGGGCNSFEGAVYIAEDLVLTDWLNTKEQLLLFDVYRQQWADSLEKATRGVLRDMAAHRQMYVVGGVWGEIDPSKSSSSKKGLGFFGWAALIAAGGTAAYFGKRAWDDR